MRLNNAGYLLICEFEGLSLKPYLCPAKIPTIGYGNTFYSDGSKVKMSDPAISKYIAFEMFKTIADDFAKKVSKLITSPLNQNQFNAIVSFSYNCGISNLKSSTLLKKVNFNPSDLTIKDEFLKWDKSRGKVLKGLTRRRELESEIYFNK
jgi:lysozyme